MSEVRVLEIILPLLPQGISRKVEHMCEIGHTSSDSVWFVYEGRCYMVRRIREDRNSWFKPCTLPAPAGAAAYGLTLPAPAGAAAYGLTLWELSK